MSENPVTCLPDTGIEQAARWMVECDCGALPVIDVDNKPIGVITDRDITCRIIAKGKDPYMLNVSDAMSMPAATVYRDTSLEDCLELMEQNQVRRMVVLDDDGTVCGMVAQADLVKQLKAEETAELMREVSVDTESPSQVH
ncbi:CBS domain-containing protein [Myxococcus sp. CA051A]|uniref:CBS domain-containing protein n=2 Tax=Myxococcaceae TaxID=31 RepID=A0A540X2B9_9BACT|nr:CBS domain-containing protein [Myxococcus sp. CA040A]NTX11799.1 CBS domain-containing protein [Myxococcus sp. CA056]NTX34100.1 CBS domain-containing protein [Myxococcus sp. CA033]NTX50910.1 CBS domain-containing protein [Myxococcus sp. CA039A]NTX65715.1 CBS domain-containing protein [Myxococcus sp. CA051A]TQF15376.1 CBS domain-containing protein [Myxococcus llanfairpwllgwyngyllgogerychwyrndrobwllllantysiliogogogochensis]